MRTYARIANGRVVEIIPGIEGVAIGERFVREIVEALVACPEGVGEGWTYDGSEFAPPEPSGPVAGPQRQFTFLEFMDLFTEAEQMTLVEASMTFPSIKLWYDKAVGASYIDLDDPRTRAGIQALVDEGLITAERKVSVIAGQMPA